MSDCSLPITGSQSTPLLLLALLLLASGLVLRLVGRRRGFGRMAAILALAVGATAVAVGDARTTDAASCPPPMPAAAATTTTGASSTSSPPPATTTSSSTTAPATTTTTTVVAPLTTTTTSVPTSTTTTSSTTTSSTTSTSTTSTSTTSTTTVPAIADLTPSIVGPTSAAPGVRGDYTLTITNVGTGPTTGPMTFTLMFDLETGTSPLVAEALGSTDWTLLGSSGGNLEYVSNPGFSLPAGAASTTTFGVTWSSELPDAGSFVIATALPAGIGGETNGANNSDSITVLVSVP